MDNVKEKFLVAPLSKDKAIVRIAGLTLITLFFTAARIYNPFESQTVVCQFKHLTGYDCPTCGLSRSIFSLMNFHPGDSIMYNPLGLVIGVGLFVLLLTFTIEVVLMRELRLIRKKHTVKIALITVTSLGTIHWIVKLIAA